MKKILLGFLILIVVVIAAVPFIAPLLDVQISYSDMYHWIVPKKKKKADPKPENTEPPKTFEAQKCDETPDIDKFPVTPLNGKVYQGDKTADVIFKSGQARVIGDRIQLKLFSSEGRASCKDTNADGSIPEDYTLVMSLPKAESDSGTKLFKFVWDLAGNKLDYYYGTSKAISSLTAASAPTSAASTPSSAPAASTAENPMAKNKQLIQGYLADFSLEAKAGGKAKGKAILCFAQPSPNAPSSKPAGYEDDESFPLGFRHAIAGNFEVEFCP